jgi:hypothetical protein
LRLLGHAGFRTPPLILARIRAFGLRPIHGPGTETPYCNGNIVAVPGRGLRQHAARPVCLEIRRPLPDDSQVVTWLRT